MAVPDRTREGGPSPFHRETETTSMMTEAAIHIEAAQRLAREIQIAKPHVDALVDALIDDASPQALAAIEELSTAMSTLALVNGSREAWRTLTALFKATIILGQQAWQSSPIERDATSSRALRDPRGKASSLLGVALDLLARESGDV
jgi:hypothetical protein